MKTTLALAAACAIVLAVPAAAADAPARLELEVGQTASIGGSSGMCDDPNVATITLNEPAVITAVKPGKTTCSARLMSVRRVYEVTVKERAGRDQPKAPRKPGATEE